MTGEPFLQTPTCRAAGPGYRGAIARLCPAVPQAPVTGARSVFGQEQAAQKQDLLATMTASPASRSPNQAHAGPVSRPRRLGTLAIIGSAALALSGTLSGCVHHRKPHVANALAPSNVTTIGVNSYLWHASLDALSFMPLVQADSAGGVIVTDWYANPANPGERMKITVTILDRDLRSDALRVAASRQVSQAGQWVNVPVQAATVQRLEDVILTKARDLRRSAVPG